MKSKRRFGGLIPSLAVALGCAVVVVADPALAAGSVISVPAGGALVVPAGGLVATPCSDLSDSGTVQVGPGQITGLANVGIGAGGTLDGGSGLIQLSGNWNNSGTFIPGTGTVRFNNSCTAGPMFLGDGSTFNNLDLLPGSYTVSGCPGVYIKGALTIAKGVVINSTDGAQACIFIEPGGKVIGTPGGNIQFLPNNVPVPALGGVGLALLVLLLSAFGARKIGFGGASVRVQVKNAYSKIRKGTHHV
jgi:hypothetical protein